MAPPCPKIGTLLSPFSKKKINKTFNSSHHVKSTIGAMNSEQVSYDNITSLFYCVVVVFPVLVVLDFLLYWLYQTKVIYKQYQYF